MSDAIPDAVAYTVSDAVSNGVPDAATYTVADAVPNAIPNAVPNIIPNGVPDAVSDAIPNVVPNVVSNVVPNAVPNADPIAVADAVAHTVSDAVSNGNVRAGQGRASAECEKCGHRKDGGSLWCEHRTRSHSADSLDSHVDDHVCHRLGACQAMLRIMTSGACDSDAFAS
jgi:hypothetical protein